MVRTIGHQGNVAEAAEARRGDAVGEVLDSVQLPLENVEYAIAQYLLANGQRLDTETRVLLAGVRDCIARVAMRARRLAG